MKLLLTCWKLGDLKNLKAIIAKKKAIEDKMLSKYRKQHLQLKWNLFHLRVKENEMRKNDVIKGEN